MKRLLAILAAIFITVALWGCGSQEQPVQTQPSTTAPAQPNETQPTEPSQPSEPTIPTEPEEPDPEPGIEILQKPMYALTLVPVTNESKAQDGTVIFKEITQSPYLVLPEPGVANKVLLDLGNKLNMNESNVANAIETAEQAYSNSMGWFSSHLMQLTYTPQRFDSGVLSLSGVNVSYTGGPHADYNGKAVSYDLLTGNVLTLSAILDNQAATDTLTALIIDALDATKQEQQLFEGYETVISDLMNTEITGIKNWYFTDSGLCFFYDPYEVAPFTAGIVTAEIPYSSLVGILKDEYFPAEKDLTEGIVNITPFTMDAQSNFTQFSELILSANGTTFLLNTDKSVSNLQIYAANKGLLSVNNLTSDAVAFKTYMLTPGDAVTVSVDFSVTDLILSYESGDKIVIKTIILSGDDVIIR